MRNQDICTSPMSSPWTLQMVECDVFLYLHIADLSLLRGMSKTMRKTVDSMPHMWRNGLQKALPNIHFRLHVIEQLEQMAPLVKLCTLLARVTVVDKPKITIKTQDELPLLARLLNSSIRIARLHAPKGGIASGVYVFCVKFYDVNEPACIDIPLTPKLRDAVNADGFSLRVHIVLKNGKVKWMFEGLRETTGALLDMSIKCPAITLAQHTSIRRDSPPMWRPAGEGLEYQDIDVCAFLEGMDKAKQALSEGVLCIICLRDTPPQPQQSCHSTMTHANSLCLDVVRREKLVPKLLDTEAGE